MSSVKRVFAGGLQIANDRSPDGIENQVRRYAGRFRRPLRRLSAISPRYADLLFSFPAACVSIVTRRGTLADAREALRLADGGAPLADIAAALRLPMWLRKLPPEAFDQALPKRIGGESDAEFGCRVVNMLPTGRKTPACWLNWVLAARVAGGDEFALWVAAQPIFRAKWPPPINALLPLAMFAWFSRDPELEATALMSARWTTKMSMDRAGYLTRRWLHRVLQDLCLALPASRSMWAQQRHVGGYDFVPLLTSDQLAEEGVRMHNCLATYSIYVVHGICRLYSVRSNGTSIASMDVRSLQGTGVPGIAQLLARGNSKAPTEVQEAANAWLKLQLRDACGAEAFNWGIPSDAAFRTHVWQPYASALKSIAGTDLEPPKVTSLLRDIDALCTLEKR
jgi:hypothetical protein